MATFLDSFGPESPVRKLIDFLRPPETGRSVLNPQQPVREPDPREIFPVERAALPRGATSLSQSPAGAVIRPEIEVAADVAAEVVNPRVNQPAALERAPRAQPVRRAATNVASPATIAPAAQPQDSVEILRGLVRSTFNPTTGAETLVQDPINLQRAAEQNAAAERASAVNAITQLFDRTGQVVPQLAATGGELAQGPLLSAIENLRGEFGLGEERIRQAGGVRQAQIGANAAVSAAALGSAAARAEEARTAGLVNQFLSGDEDTRSRILPLLGGSRSQTPQAVPQQLLNNLINKYANNPLASSRFSGIVSKGDQSLASIMRAAEIVDDELAEGKLRPRD